MPKITVPVECTVGYLRDSVDIVNGLDFNDELKQAILRAALQEFTPLGESWCDTLGDILFVGIKKRKMFDQERLVHEIAIAEALIRGDASLRANLPRFTIGITNKNRLVGTLTEDFSQNKQHILEETFQRVPVFLPCADEMPSELHRQVYEALDGNIYPEALSHMSAEACGKTVIIDYDDIAFYDIEPVKEILEQVNLYRHLAYIALDQF